MVLLGFPLCDVSSIAGSDDQELWLFKLKLHSTTTARSEERRAACHGHVTWKVTVIIWGAPAKLVSEDDNIQKMIKEALKTGVHITACKACADQLGVTEALEKLHIEVKYWGVPLTDILKKEENLLTI